MATSALPGAQVLDQGQLVVAILTLVGNLIHQGPHEMNTQATNGAVLDRAIEDGGRGFFQRIEGLAVIPEDGGQGPGFRAQPQADLVRQPVVVTIRDDVGQQLVQHQVELVNVLD